MGLSYVIASGAVRPVGSVYRALALLRPDTSGSSYLKQADETGGRLRGHGRGGGQLQPEYNTIKKCEISLRLWRAAGSFAWGLRPGASSSNVWTQMQRLCRDSTGECAPVRQARQQAVCAGVSDVTRSGGLCGSCMLVWLGEEACE